MSVSIKHTSTEPKKPMGVISDENLYFGYMNALIAGRNQTVDKILINVYSELALILVEKHKEVFPSE